MTQSAPPATEVPEVTVERLDGHVAVVEIHRPPNNYFDATLIQLVADALDELEADTECRVVVLASEGRNFCAGANLDARTGPPQPGAIYEGAVRLFGGTRPIVAAVQGAAVGGGLGLALAADFRVASPESRFSANFSRLGFFPGFGLTTLLPRVVGEQVALDLLYTGRRVGGEEARALGLCDRLARPEEIRAAAVAFAAEIAESAPLSLQRIRTHMRGQLAEAVRAATGRELDEQLQLARTADFAEGVSATAERRPASFVGR
jgi:enoyl-CoA hydratase/carnithine racemase